MVSAPKSGANGPGSSPGSYVDFTFYLSTGHESVCHKSCLPQLSGLKISDFSLTD